MCAKRAKTRELLLQLHLKVLCIEYILLLQGAAALTPQPQTPGAATHLLTRGVAWAAWPAGLRTAGFVDLEALLPFLVRNMMNKYINRNCLVSLFFN